MCSVNFSSPSLSLALSLLPDRAARKAAREAKSFNGAPNGPSEAADAPAGAASETSSLATTSTEVALPPPDYAAIAAAANADSVREVSAWELGSLL